jgi:predicted NUDIX family NTP pyrophosphohydrolase
MKRSAGILLYQIIDGELRVLLAHPGGPLWVRKDEGVWTIPKGEFDDGEEPAAAAKREFFEETGSRCRGELMALTPIRQKSGKLVYGFACRGHLDPSTIVSNTFEMEWPPKSGKRALFPEVDRVEWMTVEQALEKINPAQCALVIELATTLGLNS